MISSNLSASTLAHVSNSCFLPTVCENSALILPIPFVCSLYTYKSLGTESIVTAHNFGLNDATIIESARYPHA